MVTNMRDTWQSTEALTVSFLRYLLAGVERCVKEESGGGGSFMDLSRRRRKLRRVFREFLDGCTFQFVDLFAPFISSIVTFPAQVDTGQQVQSTYLVYSLWICINTAKLNIFSYIVHSNRL